MRFEGGFFVGFERGVFMITAKLDIFWRIWNNVVYKIWDLPSGRDEICKLKLGRFGFLTLRQICWRIGRVAAGREAGSVSVGRG